MIKSQQITNHPGEETIGHPVVCVTHIPPLDIAGLQSDILIRDAPGTPVCGKGDVVRPGRVWAEPMRPWPAGTDHVRLHFGDSWPPPYNA